MGVLNLSYDSFFEGGTSQKYLDKKLKDYKYCDIIDIGAESTKPFSNCISEDEELKRIENIDIGSIKCKYKSIDSYKYNIIKFALDNGYNMINDISAGGSNNENLELSCEYNAPIVLMHMKGTPENMQIRPRYTNVVDDIVAFFQSKIDICFNIGIKESNIIIDPGIGFGKTKEHNYEIINNISRLKTLGFPVLVGLSRKSFLDFNNDSPKDRLYSSLSAMSIAVYNGADIVRVHDFKESYMSLNIIERLKNKL